MTENTDLWQIERELAEQGMGLFAAVMRQAPDLWQGRCMLPR